MVVFAPFPVIVKKDLTENQLLNLNQILRFKPHPDMDGKTIAEFSKEHWIVIDGDLDSVLSHLKKANPA